MRVGAASVHHFDSGVPDAGLDALGAVASLLNLITIASVAALSTQLVSAWRVARQRVAAGATVILTTHILEVAERLSDRIGIIQGGRLLAEGTLEELQAAAGEGRTLEDVFLRLIGAPPPLELDGAP